MKDLLTPDAALADMPPESPLQMPQQDLTRAYRDRDAPTWKIHRDVWLFRLANFVPAVLTTGVLLTVFADWLSTGGITAIEWVIFVLVGATFFWISLSVSTVTIGLARYLGLIGPVSRVLRGAGEAKPLKVALLVPSYNEVTADVFGNAAAMCDELEQSGSVHEYALFILSDTMDAGIAAQEEHAFGALRDRLGPEAPVYYRRRRQNTDRKTGNLNDWVTRWGGGYDAMLVLDADSLMSGPAIVRLADELADDPNAGLIQSCPRLIGAETLFGRLNQFSNGAYGVLLAEGLAAWSRMEGNYWGHNAIIRTQAFAASAGLPRLRSMRGEARLILSHDFVEAGLLRRAGWGVRILPGVTGSYEETPATLVDFALRDRRWCQGNMQHLRILTATGFHAVSRFHMFHGAFSYLLSPAWFVLLCLWALLGNGQEASVIRFFSDTNPLYPDWPKMSSVDSLFILFFMYSMLLAPKVIGAATVWCSPRTRAAYGGTWRFFLSFVTEVLVSVAYAPIMMIQQTVAVLRTAVGLREKWVPQCRTGGRYGVLTLLKFHALETATGVLLAVGMGLGVVSLWLLPIMLSLLFAVPLSALSGVNLAARRWSRLHLSTPDQIDEPRVIRAARQYRDWLRGVLDAGRIPAE